VVTSLVANVEAALSTTIADTPPATTAKDAKTVVRIRNFPRAGSPVHVTGPDGQTHSLPAFFQFQCGANSVPSNDALLELGAIFADVSTIVFQAMHSFLLGFVWNRASNAFEVVSADDHERNLVDFAAMLTRDGGSSPHERLANWIGLQLCVCADRWTLGRPMEKDLTLAMERSEVARGATMLPNNLVRVLLRDQQRVMGAMVLLFWARTLRSKFVHYVRLQLADNGGPLLSTATVGALVKAAFGVSFARRDANEAFFLLVSAILRKSLPSAILKTIAKNGNASFRVWFHSSAHLKRQLSTMADSVLKELDKAAAAYVTQFAAYAASMLGAFNALLLQIAAHSTRQYALVGSAPLALFAPKRCGAVGPGVGDIDLAPEVPVQETDEQRHKRRQDEESFWRGNNVLKQVLAAARATLNVVMTDMCVQLQLLVSFRCLVCAARRERGIFPARFSDSPKELAVCDFEDDR
jgi:hypothetical protein